MKERLRDYNASRRPEARGSLCHAPSVNLNFDQTGNVTACCYNRTYLIGTYPRDSIEAMWTGEPARELRERLRQNDLSQGCTICADQLAAGNYAGMLAKNFDLYADQKTDAAPWPQVMEFELSNVCNLECVMCTGHFSSLIRRNREKLPPVISPYDKDFVEQLKPYLPRLQTARFLGGEPFLNTLYYDIWEALAASNDRIQPSITTNGTVYDAKVERVLETLKPHLVVSIDSLDPVRYERIRQRSSFEKVKANLDHFLAFAEKHSRSVTVAVCPLPDNWTDLAPLVDFCNARNARIYFNTVVWPPECSMKNLPSRELEKITGYLQGEAASRRWLDAAYLGGLAERPREAIQCFLDVIQQIQGWRRLAETRERQAISMEAR